MASDNCWQHVAGQRISRRRTLVAAGATSLGAAFLAARGAGDGGGGSSGVAKEEASSNLITKPADTYRQAKRGGTLKLNHFLDLQGPDQDKPPFKKA